MLGFLTPVGKKAVDPLTDPLAADAFWRILPRSDPIAAQTAVCAALADFVARDRPDLARLRALLTLDRRARVLVDALLVNYVAGNPQPSPVEPPSWQAAFELCRSFGRAYGQMLRSMRDNLQFRGWREHLPASVLRLFQHRHMELLLRPYVDERGTRFSWKELHEAYRFAHSCGVLHATLPISRCHSTDKEENTLEREYIHVLMQDLMNGGQLPPHDAFQVSQSFPRWCRAAALASHQVRNAEHGFVVDLDGDAGLVRWTRESASTCLGLDMSPVLAAIGKEIVPLRDASGGAGQGSPLGPGRQLKLLAKVSALCATERPVIARRGERWPAASTVEVAVGLAQILRKLRDIPADMGTAPPRPMATTDDATTTVFGEITEFPRDTSPGGPSTVAPLSAAAIETVHPPLTMVDRSDSGCRLHGPTAAANPIMPGVLIAFREDSASAWTLAVVRRVKKRLAGKRIEIGVEYVGKNPRRIVVVIPESDASPDRPPGGAQPRFAALFLPESERHPVLPIKTLVMPTRELAPGTRLSVRSRAAVYTIQLKEPLEEQAEFVWSPFDIVDRWLKDAPASAAVMPDAR